MMDTRPDETLNAERATPHQALTSSELELKAGTPEMTVSLTP
jgi:hypothetical protein